MHQSTKTYGHELGLSAVFRQWRADSHCNMLHGYALAFKFVFEADELDDRNWVVDFGGLKPLKRWLHNTFDHKLIVAIDDPHLEQLVALQRDGLADVLVLPAVGCEAFAELASDKAYQVLLELGYGDRVRLKSVECKEHGANSALWKADDGTPTIRAGVSQGVHSLP